jgi:hypothetical protein
MVVRATPFSCCGVVVDLVERVFETVGVVDTVEHWWNGRGVDDGRRDLVLRFNPAGPLWEIEVREVGRHRVFEFADETTARRRLVSVLGPHWRRLERSSTPIG